MKKNPITPTIPLDADGINHGFLRLPYSRNDSAWGSVMIPITVIRNGSGPTALLTGGNHGDEYEGPIALQALTHELRPRALMFAASPTFSTRIDGMHEDESKVDPQRLGPKPRLRRSPSRIQSTRALRLTHALPHIRRS